MTRRLEITVSDEVWVRLEVARGFEPRASFVKRALESALGVSRGPDRQAPNGGGPGLPTAPASSRASVPKLPAGVRSARELASERQAALNKAKKT